MRRAWSALHRVRLRWRVGTLAAATVLLGASSAAESRPGVVASTALLLLAGIWVRREGRTAEATPKAAYGAAGSLIGLGAALLLAWYLAIGPSGTGFAGVAVVYLGVARLVTYWRSLRDAWRWRGLVVLGACAVAFTIALLVLRVDRPPAAVVALVASLLLAPLGLNLVSEDALRGALPTFGGRTRIAIGTAAFAGGSAVVVSALPFKVAAAVVVSLAVMTFLVVADFAGDVFVVVAVVALGATFLPDSVAPGRAVVPRDGDDVVVVLGDSYTSGEGAQRFFRGTNVRGENECRRAPTAYAPVAVAAPGDAIDAAIFIACSGALAEHVTTTAQYPDEPAGRAPVLGERGLPQLRHYEWIARELLLDHSVQLVVIGIGGNDAGFGDIGRACIGPGNCAEYGDRWLAGLPRVYDELVATFTAVSDAFADVPVLVVPYPIPLTPAKADCEYTSFQDREHLFLAGFTAALDDVVEAAAETVGLHVLESARTVLERDDLRICDTNDPDDSGINFVARNAVDGAFEQTANPLNWLHNSLHPNERGHAAIAGELRRWIRTTLPTIGPRTAPTPTPSPRRDLEDLGLPDDFDHCEKPGTTLYCGDDPYEWLADRTARALVGGAAPAAALAVGAWLLALGAVLAYRESRPATRRT